jgi:hypothetical protein
VYVVLWSSFDIPRERALGPFNSKLHGRSKQESGVRRKRESHRYRGVDCVLCVQVEDVCMSVFGKKAMSERRVRGSCDPRTDLDTVSFPARAIETCIYDLKVEGSSTPLVPLLRLKRTESRICRSEKHSDRVVVCCVCFCFEKNDLLHPENGLGII